MRTSLRIRFVHLALLCVAEVYGTNVTIQSNPPANGGWVQTHPDQTVSLTCSLVDSAAPEELQWLRNGRQVSLQDGNRVNTSHVCVQPVSRDDNGATFTCQLRSDAGVQVSVRLEVQYPPTLGRDEDVSAEEKSEAVLSCDVRANPPVSVLWEKDDELLDLSSSDFQTSNNGFTATLRIRNVRRDQHQSAFTCVADSSVYGGSRRSFRVTVSDPVMKFPLGPTIAGVVVVLATMLLAAVSRWERIVKCFR